MHKGTFLLLFFVLGISLAKGQADFAFGKDKLSFQIMASNDNPIQNLCFELRN